MQREAHRITNITPGSAACQLLTLPVSSGPCLSQPPLKPASCRRKRTLADFLNTTAQQEEMTSLWIESWSKNICFWLSKQKVLSTFVTVIETWLCKLTTTLFILECEAPRFVSRLCVNISLPPASGLEKPFQVSLGTLIFKPHHKGKQITLWLPNL